jgi:hypothetical protein
MRRSQQSVAIVLMLLGGLLAKSPAADSSFPLRVSDNHRYLVDAKGRPFFVLGDTPWFLQKVRIEEVRRIMDDRKAKGFNTLFLEILDDSALPSRDAYRNVAFDPPLDITRPVEAYWRYADRVMEEAEKRGFFVIMSELWYGAGEGLWMHHVTPESARAYGTFLGKRYARFRNLMWMQCGDRNPDQRLTQCTRAIALAIRAEAPGQLQTAHLSPGFASAAFFDKESWLDVNMAYTYGAAYLHVLPEYARSHPVRPILLGETGYEGEPNAIELLPDAKKGELWNPYRIRRNAWWAVLSGTCGYCAGTKLWRYESNWKELLNARSIAQAPLIKKLLEPVPWWRLVPDTKHEFVAGGFGTWKQADYVTAAVADNGSVGIAYVPGQTTLNVDLSKLSGPVRVQWFDPATGDLKPAAADRFKNGGRREFTTPGKNSDGDWDWVLVLGTE